MREEDEGGLTIQAIEFKIIGEQLHSWKLQSDISCVFIKFVASNLELLQHLNQKTYNYHDLCWDSFASAHTSLSGKNRISTTALETRL